MWPLYILLNKFLRTEEENGRGPDGDHLTAVEAYSFERSLSNGKYNDAVLPHSHFIEVPLINQQCTWDCGLACILMVLRTLGISNCNIQELGELCCTTSVWTVDLAYLLQKFSVSFSYFTVTLGANPNFSVETFYKEQLPNDLVRVDMLFQKALESGMNIQCRSISGEEISLLILSGKYIAIALVDQYKLSQSWLEDVWVSGCYSGNSGYTGHYVVICGYDAVTDEFEIRDPASSRKHEKVTSKRLEEARKSFGTDEDLLLMPSLHILVMKNDSTPNIEAITAVLAGVHRSPFSLPKLLWSGLEPLHCRISLENGENQNTPSIQLSSLVTFDT